MIEGREAIKLHYKKGVAIGAVFGISGMYVWLEVSSWIGGLIFIAFWITIRHWEKVHYGTT